MPARILIIIFLLLPLHTYSDSLSILFLGDTYFGEAYQTNPQYNDGANVINEYGYDYFFENVKDVLYKSDYTIANLETSLINNTNALYDAKPYSHWAYGKKTCAYLMKYGINTVSLGNNHVMDFGLPGIMETVNLLDKYGLTYFGGGLEHGAAIQPLVKSFTVNGKVFDMTVIGGFEYRASYDTLYNAYAKRIFPGVNKFDSSVVINQIKKLTEHGHDPFIILFPHWGKNYRQAQEYQKEMAHQLIDAGADLIIGHGSHTVQEIEEYNGKWIIYNIGNFIFNAPGRYGSTGAKPYSLMAELVVTGSGQSIKLYPVFCNNKDNDYQLRLLDEDEMQDCYSFINTGKNSKIQLFSNFIQLK